MTYSTSDLKSIRARARTRVALDSVRALHLEMYDPFSDELRLLENKATAMLGACDVLDAYLDKTLPVTIDQANLMGDYLNQVGELSRIKYRTA